MFISIKELNHMFGMIHQILQFQSNTLTFYIFLYSHSQLSYYFLYLHFHI